MSKQNEDTRQTQSGGSQKSVGTTKSKQEIAEEVQRQLMVSLPSPQLLQDLVSRPISDSTEADIVRGMLREMLPPQTNERMAVLQATLGSYYQGTTDQQQLTNMISLYVNELMSYPDWALKEACIWWVSRQNADRRRKPLPGDISEVAEQMTQFIRVGQKRLDQFEQENEQAQK